jgi:hypothetical protein
MKITRYCDVCESILGKLRKATYVASGEDQYGYLQSWNECSNHEEYQNHLAIRRIQRQSFEEWFTEHGFDYDFSSGQANFPATKKKQQWRNINQPMNSAVAAMLSKLGGMVSR